MAQSAGPHESLRREWAETPPDVSYRFVVSLDTLRAADAVARAARQKRQSWWQRALAFLARDTLRLIVGAMVLALFGWLALQLARVVDRAWDAGPGSGKLVPVVVFLVVFIGLLIGFRAVANGLVSSSLQRFHREYYADNEFLLEGRKSHLWFDEQSAGAIRRWSTFEQLVEFDGGLWLFLRHRTTFAGQRGILVSKESRPGSCSWDTLKAYLTERIEQAVKDETA